MKCNRCRIGYMFRELRSWVCICCGAEVEDTVIPPFPPKESKR